MEARPQPRPDAAPDVRTAIPLRARMADDADWTQPPVDYSQIGRPGRKFSWLSPRTLWRSRNNVLATLTGDPTENARRAWVAAQRKRLADRGVAPERIEDFMISRPELDEFACMVWGDSGEGDVSQYSVVPGMLSAAEGTEFAVIASDIVYPAGDVNEYLEKFFVPYAGYPRPIYAIPGNHDWLDGLAGFMRHFCAAEAPEEKFRPHPTARYTRLALLLHRIFWRRPRALEPETLIRADELRGTQRAGAPRQPNMYFCIDTPNLRIIGIDTGILGRLDYDQGEWLKRVARGGKPKLLISGKPIYAGPNMSPRRILPPEGADEGAAGMLWSIVRDPENNFVAMIAGDVHHYERHDVKLPGGRILPCIISGGGGAFMTSTHQIPPVVRDDVDESSWVVFPTRGDSLRAYSVSLMRRINRFLFWRRRRTPHGIPADEAAAIVAERHGLDVGDELARGEGAGEQPVKVSWRSRLLASLVFPRSGWFEASRISEALDWDEPPFFKHFIRVEVAADAIELTVFGVSGLARDVDDPPVIDHVRIPTGGAA